MLDSRWLGSPRVATIRYSMNKNYHSSFDYSNDLLEINLDLIEIFWNSFFFTVVYFDKGKIIKKYLVISLIDFVTVILIKEIRMQWLIKSILDSKGWLEKT